jgi:uncharacterized protein (DUF488 family)
MFFSCYHLSAARDNIMPNRLIETTVSRKFTMSASATLIYTIGHSNRGLEEFLDMLDNSNIRILVDIRSKPQSAYCHHFDGEALRKSLEARGIIYHWAGRQLGGFRKGEADSKHTALVEEGMRAFADYMGADAFVSAARQLLNLAGKGRMAIMCAENRPENCHRSLISDYLLLQGCHVLHLVDQGVAYEHQLDPRLRRESAEPVYDQLVLKQ